MKTTQKISGWILGLILIAGAFAHLFDPGMSSGFIPSWLPTQPVHIATFILELVLGIGVFIPAYRNKALLGIFILMILFLPIHIIDVFRAEPVIGSMTAAIIRIPIQLLLIFMAWYARTR